MLPIANAIHESIERLRPTLEDLAVTKQRIQQQLTPLVQQFSETYGPAITRLAKHAKKWQEEQKISVTEMAEHGWFPNWHTFFFEPEEDYNNLDEFMITHLDQCWYELKENIIEHCPKRKDILEVAFALHEQENYIASIPLLLTQSDGICSEEFTYFFSKDNKTKERASDQIIRQAESNEIAINFLSEILLEPFKVDLQITQSSSKYSKAAKGKGPNRHGIIHGSRKHLDYGSRINGYKAISFLAFIVYTVKDEFKKT